MGSQDSKINIQLKNEIIHADTETIKFFLMVLIQKQRINLLSSDIFSMLWMKGKFCIVSECIRKFLVGHWFEMNFCLKKLPMFLSGLKRSIH